MGDIPEVQPSTGAVKKKKDDKMSRRDPRSWDNIMKNVSNLPNQDKINFIQEKYVDLFNEFRKIIKNFQALEKAYATLHKEKEQLQAEQTRSILAKATMESLCRELQKQNKQYKDENITRLREEEEKRKEIAAKFTEKLNDITKMMEENKEKSFMLRDDNIKMTDKLSELQEKFKERDDSLIKMTKQMDLCKQLSNAQIQKLEYELTTERTIWSKERELLEANLAKSEANCKNLQDTVTALKEDVNVYRGQYSDFENTMTKSNKVFKHFKTEITEMGKKIKNLEKDSNLWKSRYQTGTYKVLELSQVNQTQVLEIAKLDSRIETLSKLCRQLQIDRTAYLKQLKSSGIQPVKSAIEEVTTAVVVKEPFPETEKEKELAQLKENLKVLQEQLTNNILAEAEEACSKPVTEEEVNVSEVKSEASTSVEEPVLNVNEETAQPDAS